MTHMKFRRRAHGNTIKLGKKTKAHTHTKGGGEGENIALHTM